MPARLFQHLLKDDGSPCAPPVKTPIPRNPLSSNINLSGAGLIALTTLTTTQTRTALVGGAHPLDYFWLVPGLHMQQDCVSISSGEFPPAAAMTTGFIFRVENAGTAWFLQRVGRSGVLVECEVRSIRDDPYDARRMGTRVGTWGLEILGPALTIVCFVIMGIIGDWWTLFVFGVLLVTRMVNCEIVRRRSAVRWKGAKEPGEQGDLLVLLAQDKWVRLRGAVDDLKAVTAGTWLRDATPLEGFLEGMGKTAVYVPAGLVQNSTQMGQLALAGLLIVSAGALAVLNAGKSSLEMGGRRVRVVGRREFERRTEMVESLVEEVGDTGGWVGKLGLLGKKGSDGVAREGELQAIVV
jgi:hypothetical protein